LVGLRGEKAQLGEKSASTAAEQVNKCSTYTSTKPGSYTNQERIQHSTKGEGYYQVRKRQRQATASKETNEESA